VAFARAFVASKDAEKRFSIEQAESFLLDPNYKSLACHQAQSVGCALLALNELVSDWVGVNFVGVEDEVGVTVCAGHSGIAVSAV
jgi:hypothetical protein